MRSAKEQNYFPYDSKTTCYILVRNNGEVDHITHSLSNLKNAYDNVLKGEAKLYAVWPGNYRSDLFIIDDLNAFADAVGIPRKSDHIHKIKWKLSEHDDGKSVSALVEITFECDCSLSKMGIKKFANDMREQRGWEVATSKGWSSGGSVNQVYVRRSSLK